jgi:hypothetical protein
MRVFLESPCGRRFKIAPLDAEQFKQVFPIYQGFEGASAYQHWKTTHRYYEWSEFSTSWLADCKIVVEGTAAELA